MWHPPMPSPPHPHTNINAAIENAIPLAPDEALLLSAAIAADTVALSAEVGRARALDHQAAAALTAVHGRAMAAIYASVEQCMSLRL